MSHNPEDDGLAKIGNVYFMVRSPVGGATHVINPETKKTYCGHNMVKLWNKWRPVDKLPDDKNQPTCKICQRHYADPIKEVLYTIKKELEETISEFLFMQIHTKNADGGLGRFVHTITQFMHSEKVKAKIREKLAKEKEGHT
jgi:hypothetical protein